MITDEQVQRVIDAIDRKHQAKVCAEFNQAAHKMTKALGHNQAADILARHLLGLLHREQKSGVLVNIQKFGTVAVEAYVTSKADISWH
tara:strand:+ start:568 stop:831 length:264 start_codon:yes stop_codon:yes gene_type:complete